jgi:GNAT superfamily N-acetyltransferase
MFDFTKKELPKIKLNNKVTIRKIQQKDLIAIREIFAECRPDVFGPNPSLDDVQNWFDFPWGEVTLVAELDDKVVGCMEYNSSGIIGIPGVKKKHQKKGIGSTLFYYLLKDMQKNGYKMTLADTGKVLPEAISMYRRFNFDLSLELWNWIKILD